MAYAFDSLGYSKRLRDAGIPVDQAEAHAEAARDFVMVELVTKTDLLAVKTDLQSAIDGAIDLLSARMDRLAAEARAHTDAIAIEMRAHTDAMGVDAQAHTDTLGARLDRRIDALEAKIDKLGLQLTVRLGALMVAGLGALAVIIRLH